MESSAKQDSVAEGATAAERHIVCADVAKKGEEGSAAGQKGDILDDSDVEQAIDERQYANIEFLDACDDLSEDGGWTTTDDESELSFEDAEVGRDEQFADYSLQDSSPAHEKWETVCESGDPVAESSSSESKSWVKTIRRLLGQLDRETIGRQQAEERVTTLEEQLRSAGLVPLTRPEAQSNLAERTAGRVQ
ncbi:hypothetical protein CBOM_01076 [Ceraceosorus bombacis]|uniref:Uncharacterized protein n=1 Tax=Ceraceosorus bombacis TaxID=401625 RepID=A0A0P1BCH4_9BASI|nr:hypothetical protein CBOM_01076 [Ceraceosorus bombacis]